MSKSKKDTVRLNDELKSLFEDSKTQGIASRFKIKKQRFEVESPCGVLECKADFQRAADVLNSFFRNLFYEVNEEAFGKLETRTPQDGDYTSNEDLQSLLSVGKKDRAVLMPHALRLLEEQLPSAIEDAIESLVKSVKEQTLRELDGRTSLPPVDTQAMRELTVKAYEKTMRDRADSPKRGRRRLNPVRLEQDIREALEQITDAKDVTQKKIAFILDLNDSTLRMRCERANIKLEEMIEAHKKKLNSVRK